MSAKVSFLHFRFSNGLYFFLCDSEQISVGHIAHGVELSEEMWTAAVIQREQRVVGDGTSAAIDWNT